MRTKELFGIVVEVLTATTITNRISTKIVTDYVLGELGSGGCVKRKALNIRSVRAVPDSV